MVKRVASAANKFSDVHQNMQGLFNYLSLDFRLAGQNLSPQFPAILVNNNPPSLTLRRALVTESFFLCQDVLANVPVDRLIVGKDGSGLPGCPTNKARPTLTLWNNYVQSNLGYPFKAFVYDIVSKNGIYVRVQNIVDTGSEIRLMLASPQVFSQTLHSASNSVYLIEELEFKRNNDSLSVTLVNRDVSYKIAFNIENVSFRAVVGNSIMETFNANNNWTQLDAIETSVQFKRSYLGDSYSNSLVFRFYPRNIMSN
ncbi:MAG: hypothetical protein N2654_00895 [Deltaproteobacteria bacterium]|nr:hypothetical protein [Deltaproteobacteria bacterium]